MVICIIHADYLDIIWSVYLNLRIETREKSDENQDK
jgi:hypothetical protein